jgi:hypothetical protein
MFVPRDWSKVSNVVAVEELISAASLNNECDNRENLQDAHTEVLRRLDRGHRAEAELEKMAADGIWLAKKALERVKE